MGALLTGLGMAPLAGLTSEATADIRTAFERLAVRLQQPDVTDKLKTTRFGASYFLAGARTPSRLFSTGDTAELERLADRLLDVATWAELFAD